MEAKLLKPRLAIFKIDSTSSSSNSNGFEDFYKVYEVQEDLLKGENLNKSQLVEKFLSWKDQKFSNLNSLTSTNIINSSSSFLSTISKNSQNGLFDIQIIETDLFVLDQIFNVWLNEKQNGKIFSTFAVKNDCIFSFKEYFHAIEYELNHINIVGHRGNGANSIENVFPIENTINSFNMAISKGAQMVELDVHLTLDNVLVVYHNNDVNGKSISKMTYDEFLKASNSVDIFINHTTLNNILENISKEVGIYVEIKYDPAEDVDFDYSLRIVINTLSLLSQHSRKFLVSSFSPLICGLVKLIAPQFKVGLIIDEDIYKTTPAEFLKEYLLYLINEVQLDCIISDSEFYENISFLKQLPNITRMIYGKGTNNALEVKKFQDLGVTGFCTDKIDIYTSSLSDKQENQLNNLLENK